MFLLGILIYQVYDIWRYGRGNQKPQVKDELTSTLAKQKTKGQTMVGNTLHRQLNVAQHEHKKHWSVPEGIAVPTLLVPSVVL
jgi:hypothetical protein